MLPGFLEAGAHSRGLVLLALCFECLCQSEERPAVFRVDAQVLPENCLCFIRPSGFEEYGAERLPDRCMPVRRLLVDQAVLIAHGTFEMQKGAVPLLAAGCDLTRHHFRGDAKDRDTGVDRERC